MNKASDSKVRTLLGILLSVLIILCGVCLMAACLSIYHSGDQPFSRESVAAAFAPISRPIYLCLAAIVLAFLIELLRPAPAVKAPARRQTAMLLRRMQERTDLDLCPEDLRSSVLAHRSSRRRLNRIGFGILVLCSVIFLSYGANPHNFHQSQINDSMIRAMYVLLPCCLISFGFGVFAAYRNLASMDSEITLLKTAPAESRRKAPPAEASRSRKNMVRDLLLIAGIVILVYGFFTGGTADVLTKAVNICTECVGLG